MSDVRIIASEGVPPFSNYWVVTNGLRWYRPPHGSDNDLVLQQLWQCSNGMQEWRDVPSEFAD